MFTTYFIQCRIGFWLCISRRNLFQHISYSWFYSGILETFFKEKMICCWVYPLFWPSVSEILTWLSVCLYFNIFHTARYKYTVSEILTWLSVCIFANGFILYLGQQPCCMAYWKLWFCQSIHVLVNSLPE